MQSKALSCALNFLARREYGAQELILKLEQKGFDNDVIKEALLDCQRLGLQSDARFCEAICRARIRQGYGPNRIRQELLENKIDPELITAILLKEEDNWLMLARAVRNKKYKEQRPVSFADAQKQKQFLYCRGFSMDIIANVFREVEAETY